MQSFRFSTCCWLFVVLLAGGSLGCGNGSQPEVPEGRFTAEVEGGLTDTISGPAYYRLEAGELVGLELGARNAPGLSMQLEPRPLNRRTYEAVNWELFQAERSDTPPGVLAFLVVGDARFEATRGTLEVTYFDEDEVGASFEFEMEGALMGGSSPETSVQVTGSFRAREEREE